MKIWKIVLIIISLVFFVVGIGMSFIPQHMFVESGSIIAVSMISLPAFYGIYKIYGKRGIVAIAILGIFALIIESIGIHTGWPYSPFMYTNDFGYRLFGTTPWTVFIAWSPLVIGAWLLAHTWFKQQWSRYLIYLGVLVGTDIILDPGAVARGLWKYQNGGLWFDVPLQNFIGWIISGTIAYALLRVMIKYREINNKKYIWIGSLSLLLSIFLWTGVNAGYGLWLPVILGTILGIILLLGLCGLYKKSSL